MSDVIPFNIPALSGKELDHLGDAIKNHSSLSIDSYLNKCRNWFLKNLDCQEVFLTPSCTDALEMAAMLIGVEPGDEIIMPSYTFVSTANAFVLRGAKIVFVDIRRDTLNIDETKIEQAINSKTKAIVPVHYAGVACEMDFIMCLAKKYSLFVVEDAAQSIGGDYKSKPLGSIGHLGAISFHATKNINSGGEGGALVINDSSFIDRAQILYEKGTNRQAFTSGLADKYTWVDIGSSFLMSEIQAAFLFSQLCDLKQITARRFLLWNKYHEFFSRKKLKGFSLPQPPNVSNHNAHIYYLVMEDESLRERLRAYLLTLKIEAPFHYVPLHSSPSGLKYGSFLGNDAFTTTISKRLIRLPLYESMTLNQLERVTHAVEVFISHCSSNNSSS